MPEQVSTLPARAYNLAYEGQLEQQTSKNQHVPEYEFHMSLYVDKLSIVHTM